MFSVFAGKGRHAEAALVGGGVRRFFGEAARSGDAALDPPHTRLGWRGAHTTPGLRSIRVGRSFWEAVRPQTHNLPKATPHPGTRASRPHPYSLPTLPPLSLGLGSREPAVAAFAARFFANSVHGLTLPFARGRYVCCRTGRPQGSSSFTSEAKCCRRYAAQVVLLILCILCIDVHKKHRFPAPFRSTQAAAIADAVPVIVPAGRRRSRVGPPPHPKPQTWFTSRPRIGQEAWFNAQVSLPP